MGLLDGLLGGVVGAGLATAMQGLIEKHGGIGGIVQQFEAQGLGPTVQSWIGAGPNAPVTPDQIHQAFGSDAMTQMATKLGISPQDLAQKLSQFLPQAIDKLTPNGSLPAGS
jgi:uncharacterized protein YidB (DUF937 family)